jgi:hypothetical protein
MKGLGRGLMVHVEGTRALACRTPVAKLSSAFLDLAVEFGLPIVPVRFTGGLPVESVGQRLDFPVGFGKQAIWLGRPLLPDQLAKLPLKERKELVLGAMNGLGPDLSTETSHPGDPAFGAAVEAWRSRSGASLEGAVLFTILAQLQNPGLEAQALLESVRSGVLTLGDHPRSQWLGCLARRLFGPQGPVIEGLW